MLANPSFTVDIPFSFLVRKLIGVGLLKTNRLLTLQGILHFSREFAPELSK